MCLTLITVAGLYFRGLAENVFSFLVLVKSAVKENLLHLGFIEPQIAPFDPRTPKNLA